MSEIRNFGSEIFQAYLAGRQFREQKEAREREAQMKQQMFQEEQKQFQEKMKFDQEKFKVEQQARQADFNLKKLSDEMNWRKMAAEGLIPINRDPDGSFSINPQPGIILKVQDPSTYGKAKLAIEAPTLQQKLADDVTKANNTFQNNKALEEFKFDNQVGLEGVRQEGRKELQKSQQDFTAGQNALQRNQAWAIAQLQARTSTENSKRAHPEGSPEAANAQNEAKGMLTKDLLTGTATLDTMAKLVPQKERMEIFAAVKKMGGVPLSDKQAARVDVLVQVRDIANKAKRLNQLMIDNGFTGSMLLEPQGAIRAMSNPEIRTLVETMQVDTANLARTNNDRGAFSDKDMIRNSAVLPTFSWLGNNITRVGEIERMYRTFEAMTFGNIPKTQAEIIKKARLSGATAGQQQQQQPQDNGIVNAKDVKVLP